MKIFLDENFGITNINYEETTQDSVGYNIIKCYVPSDLVSEYDSFGVYYAAVLPNSRKVGYFALEGQLSSDEANYTLYKASLHTSVVSVAGVVQLGFRFLYGDTGDTSLTQKTTPVIQFPIRKSVSVNNDILILDSDQDSTDVLQSYKNLLETALATYVTKLEIDNKLDLKADKSDTYTKAQVDNKLDLKADKAELAEVYSKEYNLINDLTRTDNYRYNSNTAGISAATGYYIYTSLQLTANTTYYFHNIMGYFSFIVGGNRFSESTANLLDGAYTPSQDEAILLCSATTSNVIFTDSYYIYLNLVANENKYLATENFINPNITLEVPNYMTLLTSGKYWSSNGIGVSEGTSASADTYARLRLPAGTYYLKNAYGYFCWYQTSNGYSRVSNTTETVGNYTFTMSVEGGSLYVTTSTGIVPFLYNDQDAYNKALSSGTHIKPSLLTAYRTAAEQDTIDDALGVTVVTVKMDGTGDYTSLTAAANSITDASASKRYEIHIYAGTYDILTELGGSDFLSGITSTANNRKGVQIKNYVSLIGIGDVFLEYLPSDSVSTIYTTTCVSPIEVYGNTTIENIHIKAKNCRYCVHDETGNSSIYANSKHIYKNCFFEHLGNYSGGWVSSAAIASGSSSGCRYAYIDCTFKSASFYAWSLHNNANQNGLIISFDGCVFDGLYGNFTGKISYYGINSTNNVSYIFMKNSTSTYPFGIFQENSGVTSTNIYELHNFSTIKFYNDSTYVPNELNDLRDDLTTAETNITTLQSDLTTVMQVNKNYTDNAINDLRWELGSHTLDVSSDTDVAFSKSVPANTIGCQINKIGGTSYKSENLFDINTVYGDTTMFTITNDTISAENPYSFYSGSRRNFKSDEIGKTLTLRVLFTSNCIGSNLRFKAVINEVSQNGQLVSSFPNYSSITITPTSINDYFCMDFSSATKIEISEVMLNEGSTALPFQPYFEGIRDSAVTSVVSKDSNDTTLETLTIDSNIQELDGYGWGVNDTCYNYIDFEAKKFIKKVGRVDLGTLDYTYGTTNEIFYATISGANIPDTTDWTVRNMLCNKYDFVGRGYYNPNYVFDKSFYADRHYNKVGFKDSNYTDATTFKTAMSGVYLYYELATPVETDISEYIEDNIIEVEPNGTLTFNNTYEQAVPSEIDYLIEEVKA